MLPIPQLYPDELVSGWLVRSCRYSGLSFKGMMAALGWSRRSHFPFSMGTNFHQIGALTRMNPRDLLWWHSVFPYVVAFMPSMDVSSIEEALLTEQLDADHTKLPLLSSNVSKALHYRRFCPDCAKEELVLKGESYWHRSHQLPAAYVCLKHQCMLFESDIAIRHGLRRMSYALPHEAAGQELESFIPLHVLADVTRRSVELLSANPLAKSRRYPDYRLLALAKGYQFKRPWVAGTQLAHDLLAAYGGDFLARAGCAFNKSQHNPWPSLLIRNCFDDFNFAPARHILLQTFLDHCDSSPKAVQYKRPGKHDLDHAALDTQFVRRVSIQIRRVERSGRTIMVSELLTRAGCWAKFRHHRERYPETVALLREFKKTANSVRPKKD